MKKIGMWIVIIASMLIFGAFFGAMGYFMGVMLVPMALDLMRRYFKDAGMRWPYRLSLAGVIVLLWVLTVGPWLNRQMYAHLPLARYAFATQRMAIDLFFAKKVYPPAVAQETAMFRFAVEVDSIEARHLNDSLLILKEKMRAGTLTEADRQQLQRLIDRVKKNKQQVASLISLGNLEGSTTDKQQMKVPETLTKKAFELSEVTAPIEVSGQFTLPARSEANGVPFFSLYVEKVTVRNDTVTLKLVWDDLYPNQTASIEQSSYLTDNTGNRYALVAAKGIEIGTYENQKSIPLKGKIEATLYFVPQQTVNLNIVHALIVNIHDVWRPGREWTVSIPIQNSVQTT